MLLFIVISLIVISVNGELTHKLKAVKLERQNVDGNFEEHLSIFLLSKSKNENKKLASNPYRYYYRTNPKKQTKKIYTLKEATFLFKEFKLLHNKSYKNNVEEQKRLEIFSSNLEIIQELRDNENGTAIYGATKFADLTADEFLRLYTGYVRNDNIQRNRLKNINIDNLPVSRDWRQNGAVTEVKNQGSCGSCWAFSTTGNIEGVWQIKKKSLVSLSEQQLVDCDKLDFGCSGGDMLEAYKEIERMGGLETEGKYPYKGSKARSCGFNTSEVKVYINDSISLPKDEQQIAKYVDENGPVAIGINASPLMFYMGGIVHPYKFFCNPHHLNHGVVIVGFGVQGDKPYWTIKNSWGANWGESGYFRLFRGQGVCGVDQDASSVIIY